MRTSTIIPACLLPLAALGGLCLFLTGCNILEPKSDPTRLYVLRTTPAATPTLAGSPVVPALRVGPGRMATYLDVTPLVVQSGPNRVEQLSIDHWAEPFSKGVSRVFGEYLGQKLNGTRIVLYPEPAGDVTLEVRYAIDRLEGPLRGSMTLKVSWQVVDLKSGEVLHAANTVQEIPNTNGSDVPAYVDRISMAVSRWADDVAAAIRAAHPTPAPAK